MKSFAERDLRVNWHPDTQMRDLDTYPPLVVHKAKGRKLFDEQGKDYYDAISSWWCQVHGHCHPKIAEAISKQANELDHVLFGNVAHPRAVEFSELLLETLPKDITKVFYSDNGSTAVEVALKMAVQYFKQTGKPDKEMFIHLDDGYHGDTLGAMSVGSIELYASPFKSVLFKSISCPSPKCGDCTVTDCAAKDFGKKWGEGCDVSDAVVDSLPCLKDVEELFAKNHERVAAIILEPLLLGAGRLQIYPPAWLKGVSKLARKYGILLIADEVATGFYRTGKFYALEHAGISADMICLCKGITSGTMPLAVTAVTEEIYAAFLGGPERAFWHGHTYTANAICCAAAIASLKLFDEEQTAKNADEIAPLLFEGMKRYEKFDGIKEVRGLGMVAAMEIETDPMTGKNMEKSGSETMKMIYQEGLKNGLLIRPQANISYLFLPQSTKKEELSEIFERLDRVYAKFFR